jgi:roadblock/LC7 domain-containing protein
MIDSQPLLANATVHYSRFGALDIDWPGCGNRTCLEIVAQPKGDEVMILQPLHEYCVKNTLDRVVYIHSKGTYTATRSNEVLRNVLMKAVMSTECIDMANSDGTCNTCSTQLQALPFTCYTGNMWVAECAYVKKLIPPKDYEPAKQKIHKEVSNATKRIGNSKFFKVNLDNGTTTFKFKETTFWQIERESWFGGARYAMEHWLGSHPDLKPCDVFSRSDPGTPTIGYSAKKLNVTALVPRLRVSMKGAFAEGGFQPWFMHEGKLYEYKALYSKVPDNSSWFYRYFNINASAQ